MKLPPEKRLFDLIKQINSLPLLRLPEGLDLSPASVALLRWVSKSPGCGVLDIAKGLGLSAPTISVGIRKLVKGGWLERRRDPDDLRARPLYLTAQAKNLLTRVRQHRTETLQVFLSGLSAEEQEQLIDLLEKAVTSMEKSSAEQNDKAA